MRHTAYLGVFGESDSVMYQQQPFNRITIRLSGMLYYPMKRSFHCMVATMSDTASQQWLWIDSWPDAISGVIHELRLPVVTMQNAFDLIQQFTACQTYQPYQPILRTHAENLTARIDQLFDLRARFERTAQHGEIVQRHAEAIRFVQAISSALRNDLLGLQQDMQAVHTNCYTDLEPQMQAFFTLAQTNANGYREVIQSLLEDGLLQRFHNEQHRHH